MSCMQDTIILKWYLTKQNRLILSRLEQKRHDMTNTELYTEFKEKCMDRVTVDRDEFCKRIRKLKKGVIVEPDKGTYQLYSKPCDATDSEQMRDAPYILEIDPAVRVRFEGSLSEYEDLLKEINKNKIGKRS